LHIGYFTFHNRWHLMVELLIFEHGQQAINKKGKSDDRQLFGKVDLSVTGSEIDYDETSVRLPISRLVKG
jgi:hypothetical protein